MYDLTIKESREQLEDQILADINQWCKSAYESEHRKHLGASTMGKKCDRLLWSTFRWLKKPSAEGKMQRIFQVGHNAEARFVEYLRGIGFEVLTHDENGKQFRISGSGGHYGGSLDGRCKAPARYGLDSELVFLNEFKTSNTGAHFTNIGSKDLLEAKPEHYMQMCQYGAYFKLKYGLYLVENKNDSEIIIKIVELDWSLGDFQAKRADNIILSQEAPAKISLQPSYYECKYCNFQVICHYERMPEKNCRSCVNARPIDNGQWLCSKYGQIPEHVIPAGCPEWVAIVNPE